MPLVRLAPLWRGLCELDILSPGDEATVQILALPPAPDMAAAEQELPAAAASGALLGGGGAAVLLTQMVWLEGDERRDPYRAQRARATSAAGATTRSMRGFAHAGFSLLMPVKPLAILCAACTKESEPFSGAAGAQGIWSFGEAALLDLSRQCPHCGAALDLSRDRARLHGGNVFLLEESCARAAFSIEMPSAPEAEELPDAKVSRLLVEAFGGTDELADDRVPAAQ